MGIFLIPIIHPSELCEYNEFCLILSCKQGASHIVPDSWLPKHDLLLVCSHSIFL